MKRAAAIAVLLWLGTVTANARTVFSGEYGFLAVADHQIQFGGNGTDFSYVRDGGQDILFSFSRFSVDHQNGNHIYTLLYQPLELVSEESLRNDLRLDNVVLPAGEGVRFRYSFPFYRFSWMRDFDPDPEWEAALGLSLQIRNTTIEFRRLDGSALYRESNIGPVPIIKGRVRQPWGELSFWGAEVDGFYAPVSYINGSDEEIVGAILDASLRAGTKIRHDMDWFINLRYLGGGAVGTNTDEPAPKDGYVRNWLHFVTLSTGVQFGPVFKGGAAHSN